MSVRAYCQSSVYENPPVQQFVKQLPRSLLERIEAVALIQKEFRDQGANKPKVVALKAAFAKQGRTENWKDALLGTRQRKQVDVKFPFLKYCNAWNVPLDLTSRVVFASAGSVAAAFGSTFVTNKPERLDHAGHHLLDAAFASECYDAKNRFAGFALALGDGAGGHFGDERQDRTIARAAHFATKAAVRLMSAYQEPVDLIRDLPSLIKAIEGEVASKAQGEGTTLVACRAFLANGGYRVVGFNIGDNMLVAWHPVQKRFTPLFASHVTEAGTAILPGAFRVFEVQRLDVVLPAETVLFLLSDGVHDSLPFTEQEQLYPNQLKYRIRTLSHPDTLFHTDSLQTIVRTCMNTIQTQIKETTAPNVQIGDDFSILQCTLKEPQEEKKS